MTRGKRPTALDPVRDFHLLSDDAYLRPRAICAIFSISEATYWRMVKDGRMPVPQKFGRKISATKVGKLRALHGPMNRRK